MSCLPPEKPRNIALIYSISLKRVQRWRVSLIRSANDKNNRLSCLYANMSLLFSFNSNMKNILEIYVFSEWITTQYYLFFLAADLNPCLNVHCPRFGVCRTYSAHDARCECDDQCPSYKDPVCTANGTTYDNRCWHKLSYCRGLENNLVYHPGSCEGNENWFQRSFWMCMPHKIVWELSSRSLRIIVVGSKLHSIWLLAIGCL